MTLAGVDAAIAAAIEALGPRTRMASDLRADFRSRPASGSTQYQLSIGTEGQVTPDSNLVQFQLAVQTNWYHILADPTDERVYTLGQLATDLDAISRDSWWSNIAGVYGVPEGSALESTTTREGNCILTEITISILTDKE